MDDEFECGKVIHEKGALLLSAIGIGGDINPVALSEQGAILHSHRWEEGPLYGVWLHFQKRWLETVDGTIWHTFHIGLASATAARACKGDNRVARACIIGDDGRPVELDE